MLSSYPRRKGLKYCREKRKRKEKKRKEKKRKEKINN
jgi:hypothetical protein